MSMMEYLQANGIPLSIAVLAALLALSEALAFIPGVKANSIFQAVVNGMKSLLGFLKPKSE
jgi:hypothetical protein